MSLAPLALQPAHHPENWDGRELADSRHNTFASGGSDGVLSVWDHSAKKRMRLYPSYPTAISALAFSPDGTKLAIGVSYEHDNAVTNPEDQTRVLLLLKETVMDECKPKAR